MLVRRAGGTAARRSSIRDGRRPPVPTTLIRYPGAVGDAWEAALERLRQARSTLDVAWRAADAGDSQD